MIHQQVEPLTLTIAIAIMAVGSALQASAGIGLALFAVPILALVDRSFIPGPMLLAGVVLALSSAYRERTAIDVRALGNSLVGLAIGTVAGAFALTLVSGPLVGKTFGVLVLLAVLLSVAGYSLKPTRRSLAIAGGAAGMTGAMVGIHGPPISLIFQNAEPKFARAMLGAFFSTPTSASAVVRICGTNAKCRDVRYAAAYEDANDPGCVKTRALADGAECFSQPSF
jgi:uncharacterized membrane protein YfcA